MELERIPPPMEHRDQVVLCLSTARDPGCGHPVDWHTGAGTPAPDCDCCSWRKNDMDARAQVAQEPARTPVPAGMPPEKWAVMNRRDRRAWMKGRKR